jgi:DNA polymerase-3 subunit alpha
LEKLLENSREIQKDKINGQKNLFGGKIELKRTIPLSPATPATNHEKLTWEKELLGLYVSSHPMAEYEKVFAGKTTPINKITKELVGKTIKVGGIISTIKKIITKSGSPMIFMSLEDLGGKIEVVIFASVIAANPELFQEGKVIVVSGRVDNRNGDGPKLVAQEMQEIVDK